MQQALYGREDFMKCKTELTEQAIDELHRALEMDADLEDERIGHGTFILNEDDNGAWELVEYLTGSCSGHYEFDFVNDEVRFSGMRASFRSGTEFWENSELGEWELLESSQPQLGVWGCNDEDH